jgi:hypothetical protein
MASKNNNTMTANTFVKKVDVGCGATYGVRVDYTKEQKTFQDLLAKEKDHTRVMMLKNQLAYVNIILKEGVNTYQFGQHIIFRNEKAFKVFSAETSVCEMCSNLLAGDCLLTHNEYMSEL